MARKAHHDGWKLLVGIFQRNKGTKDEYFHGTYLGEEDIVIKHGQKLRVYSNYRVGPKPANEPTHFLKIENDS